MGRGRFFAGV